jgi:hypothetical protein
MGKTHRLVIQTQIIHDSSTILPWLTGNIAKTDAEENIKVT